MTTFLRNWKQWVSRRLTTALPAILLATAIPITKSLFADQADRSFVCNIGAIPPEMRSAHARLTRAITQAIEEKKELPDGYAFRLAPGKISAEQLAQWIDLEKKCCPFFGFEIHWEKENGPLSLHLTGNDGVKALIESELGS
jgi:uncharacterized phage protein gp47/JayE